MCLLLEWSVWLIDWLTFQTLNQTAALTTVLAQVPGTSEASIQKAINQLTNKPPNDRVKRDVFKTVLKEIIGVSRSIDWLIDFCAGIIKNEICIQVWREFIIAAALSTETKNRE